MPFASELVKGSTELLVMSLMRDRRLHGYEIIKEIRARSDGHLKVGEGSLYPLLHRLERDGLVSAEWGGLPGRDRRYYHLTARGEAALDERRAVWRKHVDAVQRVLGATG
ncbi:MAG: helix-turn-helix transcriptional regulator [Chloroflexi bacterium]|nr:helix-turn-helix transcriptional regulator [Chloroflexota bacterium]